MNGEVKFKDPNEIIAEWEAKKKKTPLSPIAKPVIKDTSPLGQFVESQAQLGTPPEEVAAEVGGLKEPGTAEFLTKIFGEPQEAGESALLGLGLGGIFRAGLGSYAAARGKAPVSEILRRVPKTAKSWAAWSLPFLAAEEYKPGSTEPLLPLMGVMGLKYLKGKLPIKGAPPGYVKAMAKHTEQVGGALQQAILKYIDPTKGMVSRIPVFPSGPRWERLEEWAGGRTVGELLESASKRAGKMAVGLLRQHRVGLGLAQTAVHKEVQPLLDPKTTSPQVMLDVMRWANPKSGIKVEELPEESLITIAKLENAMSGLLSRTSQRKIAYETLIQTNFNKKLSSLAKFDDPVLEPIRAQLQGAKTFEDAYGPLSKLIEDPKTSPAVRDLAVEVFNFPAKLPSGVYKAYSDSMYKVTTAKIRSNPNWAYKIEKPVEVTRVIDGIKQKVTIKKVRVPKENYRISKQRGMEGYIVRKDIDNALRELNYVQQHGQKFHRYLLGPWKMTKTVFSFSTQMRNVYGNLMLNDTFGPYPLPWYTPEGAKYYERALNELISGKSKELRRFSDITGIDTSAFMGGEVSKYHLPKTYGEDVFESVVRHFHKIADMKIPGLNASAPEMYQNAEKWAKYAKYLWNKKHGMTDLAASQDAVTATFDYNDVSIFVRRMRETMFPFFTWRSKMITQLPERIVTNPIRTAKYYAIPAAITAYALQRLDLSDKEFNKIKAMLPDYWRKGWFLVLPIRAEDGSIYVMNLNYLIPGLGDVAELAGDLFTDPKNLLLQNPFARLAVDLAQGTNSYTGSKIFYDWEPPSVKLSKLLLYAYKVMTPTILPGNRDWQMLWDTFVKQKKEALSPGAAVVSQFGFRMLKINPQRLKKRWIAESNERMSEIIWKRNSAIRAAKTSEKKREVREKYRKIIQAEKERRMEPWKE